MVVQALPRPSEQLRKRGNNFFQRAAEASHPSQQHALLQSALGLYFEAEKEEERGREDRSLDSIEKAEFALIQKNLAATHVALFGCGVEPTENRVEYLLLAIRHTARAVKSGRSVLQLASSSSSPGATPCARSEGPPDLGVLTQGWLDDVSLKLGERVCMLLIALDCLALGHRLVIVRQASKELRDIARDTAAGPSLALLGKELDM
jgi:hypothetical protein